MATSLTANVNVSVKGAITETGLDIGQASFSFNEVFAQAFAQGVAANQANQMWTDSRSIAGSGNDDIDFAGGITSAFGASITFTSIKAIIIKAAAANANNLIMGNEGTNPFATMFGDPADTLIIQPGGILALTAPGATGYAVTASTGDKLRLTNGGSGTINYDIIVIGETA